MRLNRKNIHEINFWPGFVDILGTLLIVTIFTVLISTITQIYFNDQLEVKRGEISTLDDKINLLLSQLDTIKKERDKINLKNSQLSKSLDKSEISVKKLSNEKKELDDLRIKSDYLLKIKEKELEEIVSEKGKLLDDLKSRNSKIKDLDISNEKYSLEVFQLKRDVEKLTKKLSELSKLLIQAEAEDEKNKVQIKNLGQRLNQALASKVAELSKYQSVFFKNIREALGNRDDVIISGDRFIFPSEIFFSSGSDIIQSDGIRKLKEVSMSLKEISEQIPDKIDWILRVDGHTDKIPINNKKFQSNWHLSSSRAINIVKFFILEGIPPHRLVAAGFGENYPIEKGDNEESLKKNRRIEIKLTTR